MPRKNETAAHARRDQAGAISRTSSPALLIVACVVLRRRRLTLRRPRRSSSAASTCRETSASTRRPIRAYLLIRPGVEFSPPGRGRVAEGAFRDRAFLQRRPQRARRRRWSSSWWRTRSSTRSAFEGNKKFKDDQLTNVVQSAPRGVFTRAKVQSDVARILELYRRSGALRGLGDAADHRAAEQPRESRLRDYRGTEDRRLRDHLHRQSCLRRRAAPKRHRHAAERAS